ncbi:MAG TPA: 1,6-anhydro-N-acetylmuramyl-L-alanine amidase AmpD [Gammaproteobacteria bacterium]|nr:1,6-anhydro-N-acetylmuramyl-L-alanine amidase AmpD [Gammaproteobacteria bacterium]
MASDAADIQGGWLTSARHLPSPNCDARPRGAVVDLVVIHGISLPPGRFGGECVEALFTNRLDVGRHPSFGDLDGLRVSSHLFIDRLGRLTQFVSFARRAWHAGVSSFEGRSRCNDYSIGIELEGCDDVPYSELQYQALIRVLRLLMGHYPAITPARVVGHCHVAPGRKTDPGPAFDWIRLRSALRCPAREV